MVMVVDGSIEIVDSAPSEGGSQSPPSQSQSPSADVTITTVAAGFQAFSLTPLEVVNPPAYTNGHHDDDTGAAYSLDFHPRSLGGDLGTGEDPVTSGSGGGAAAAMTFPTNTVNWINAEPEPQPHSSSVGFSPIVGAGRREATSTPPAEEDLEEYENETRGLLDDYKCPICLDTLINTVKVDCHSGHKFCNFCIQCWISYERQLVTECPVCRGNIYGKTLDPGTDEEIKVMFDQFSDTVKRIRSHAVKDRLQLERRQVSYQQAPCFPLGYYSSPTFNFSSGEGPQEFRYSRQSARQQPSSGRSERSGFFELAVGSGSGGYASSSRENQGGMGASTRQSSLQQQQRQPESGSGGLFYASPWENLFSQAVTPASWTLSNNENETSHHGTFHAPSPGDASETRHQHYQIQNREHPQHRWESTYFTPEEPSATSTSYSGNNATAGRSWTNYLQPSTTTEESNHAGLNTDSRTFGSFGLTPSTSLFDAVNSERSSLLQNASRPSAHAHYHGTIGAAARSYSVVPSVSTPAPTTSTSRVGYYASDFFPSCSTSAAVQTPAPSHHHPGLGTCGGFSNCYAHQTSATTAPKNYHITGPQMPSPSTSFRNQVGTFNNAACLNARNTCCNLFPAPQRTFTVGGTFPGAPSSSSSMASPPATPRSTQEEYPVMMSPRSQQQIQGDGNDGRNQQRTCHHYCLSEHHAPPHPGGSTSAGVGIFSPLAGTTTGSMSGGQGHITPRSSSQAHVSNCPILSHGSFFTGGFPLYSPRSGFVGFHISHHNSPGAVVTDRPATSPVPGRITHPIVSLVPLTPDGSSTRVSLTFEVHSQPSSYPHQHHHHSPR